MLEAQIAQKASFSSKPSDRLPSKLEPNPREHCNCVTLKEGVENSIDPEDTPIEGGREMLMVKSKETNEYGKAATFIEHESVEISTIFLPKLSDPGSFSIPYIVRKVEIERALCYVGASVNLMPHSLFHKLQLGPIQPTPFSLHLADGSETQSICKLEDVSIKIGNIWVLETLS